MENIKEHDVNDDLTTLAISHLQKLGYKVQKDNYKKHYPVIMFREYLLNETNRIGLFDIKTSNMRYCISEIAIFEKQALKDAYDEGRKNIYKSADEFIKNHYTECEVFIPANFYDTEGY